MSFKLSANTDSIYTVKIAGLSASYTTISNSGNYLHISIVEHHKTVAYAIIIY